MKPRRNEEAQAHIRLSSHTKKNSMYGHKETRKIIVKMETGKYTKVEQSPSMKTNDKGINNAEHTQNSLS
jgi:hypothetical protein